MPIDRGYPCRGEVWLVTLDPTIGSEIRKTRPAVVVSPDEMNGALSTAIVCPLTSRLRGWPTRIAVTFDGRDGEIAADQIRTVDRRRLAKRLGTLSETDARSLQDRLVQMFAFV